MLGLDKSKIFEKEKARELKYNALRSLCMSASPVLLKEFAAFEEYIGQMETDFFDWHFVLRSRQKFMTTDRWCSRLRFKALQLQLRLKIAATKKVYGNTQQWTLARNLRKRFAR